MNLISKSLICWQEVETDELDWGEVAKYHILGHAKNSGSPGDLHWSCMYVTRITTY